MGFRGSESQLRAVGGAVLIEIVAIVEEIKSSPDVDSLGEVHRGFAADSEQRYFGPDANAARSFRA